MTPTSAVAATTNSATAARVCHSVQPVVGRLIGTLPPCEPHPGGAEDQGGTSEGGEPPQQRVGPLGAGHRATWRGTSGAPNGTGVSNGSATSTMVPSEPVRASASAPRTRVTPARTVTSTGSASVGSCRKLATTRSSSLTGAANPGLTTDNRATPLSARSRTLTGPVSPA